MLLNKEKIKMLQNLLLIHGDLLVGCAIYYKSKAVPKINLYLFQNDCVLYFKSYWKREYAADTNFWCFDKLNG